MPRITFSKTGQTFEVPEEAFKPGSFQLRLTSELCGIQYGEIPHPWSVIV